MSIPAQHNYVEVLPLLSAVVAILLHTLILFSFTSQVVALQVVSNQNTKIQQISLENFNGKMFSNSVFLRDPNVFFVKKPNFQNPQILIDIMTTLPSRGYVSLLWWGIYFSKQGNNPSIENCKKKLSEKVVQMLASQSPIQGVEQVFHNLKNPA